jgi:hypothetical protein
MEGNAANQISEIFRYDANKKPGHMSRAFNLLLD